MSSVYKRSIVPFTWAVFMAVAVMLATTPWVRGEDQGSAMTMNAVSAPSTQAKENAAPVAAAVSAGESAIPPSIAVPSSGAGTGITTSPVSSDRITLDVKGMDVVEVLKILAGRAGMNMVVGKNVTGRVTVFLKDVSIQDAFETILKENDLAFETNGSIVSVIPAKDYEQRHGIRYKGDLDTKVFNLNYASAEKLSAKLKDSVTKDIGFVQVDERTNKIAVTDYPERLDKITKLVSAFDEKTPQVLIDAQVIEINPSDKFEMGVDWDYWIKKNLRVAFSMPTADAINTLKVGAAAGGNTVDAKGDYKGIIDMLRTIGDTKILSSPRIMALNNQEARILVGTKEAYITSMVSQGGTGTAVTAQNVNFVDVGIKLYVTPTINSDGFVTMKIRPEISSAKRENILSNGTATEVPIVTSSEAETMVTVKDGVTILIGGLRKDEHAKTVQKLPILGDIPLLGFFFRKTSDEVSKTELVILLTPHLMSGETPYTDFSDIKPKEGAVASMINGRIVTEKFPRSTYQQAFYDTYQKRISQKISQALKRMKSDAHGKVTLVLNVGRNGLLTSDPDIVGAADPSLIEQAGRAVMKALPFPPLPRELKKSQEEFQVEVVY